MLAICRISCAAWQTVEEIKRLRPAALITIDAPDFCFRVARKLKGQGIPLIHYVAPTVWAWRPGRARKIAQFLDHLLALLPFEPPYFTREGLACTFVGHPIVESGQGKAMPTASEPNSVYPPTPPPRRLARQPHERGFTPDAGFRRNSASACDSQHPRLQAVMPVTTICRYVKANAQYWPVPVTIVESDQDKYDALHGIKAALACSRHDGDRACDGAIAVP